MPQNLFSSHEVFGVLNAISEGILTINNTSIITFINNSAEKILNVPIKKALGQHLSSLVPNINVFETIEHRQTEPNQYIYLQGASLIISHAVFRDKNGDILGAVVIFRDITKVDILKEELDTLKDAKELLNAIIENTPDAIVVSDEKAIIILVNEAFTKMVGMTRAQLLNQPTTVDVTEGESMCLKCLTTGKPIRDARVKVGSTKREIVVSVNPVIINDEVRGTVGVLHDVSEIKRLSEELSRAQKLIRHLESKYNFEDIIGKSPKIVTAKKQALIAAQTTATVLLRGENGTGKELFAHAIHHASNRHNKPFVRVNCAAIPEHLMESELFGYEDGSFTGAKKGGRIGYFEEANDGTLFLDEIAEIPFTFQAKLLRALQEKEVIRIGSNKPHMVNARIIAATNANLEKMIQKNELREDLYYRLNVLPIFIPSLREIKEDIPMISQHLLNKINRDYGRLVLGIDPLVLERLKSNPWRGNVRELENLLRRALINMQVHEEFVKPEHIPAPLEVHQNTQLQSNSGNYTGGTYDELMEVWEKDLISKTLAAHNGNRTKAAASLNISIRSLYNKITKYQL